VVANSKKLVAINFLTHFKHTADIMLSNAMKKKPANKEDTRIGHIQCDSAPSCDHFGRHGEWKKYLAAKLLAELANWRPNS